MILASAFVIMFNNAITSPKPAISSSSSIVSSDDGDVIIAIEIIITHNYFFVHLRYIMLHLYSGEVYLG